MQCGVLQKNLNFRATAMEFVLFQRTRVDDLVLYVECARQMYAWWQILTDG